MTDNAAAWAELKADLDAQIDSLTADLDECVGQLAEATAVQTSRSLRRKMRTFRPHVIRSEFTTEHRLRT